MNKIYWRVDGRVTLFGDSWYILYVCNIVKEWLQTQNRTYWYETREHTVSIPEDMLLILKLKFPNDKD